LPGLLAGRAARPDKPGVTNDNRFARPGSTAGQTGRATRLVCRGLYVGVHIGATWQIRLKRPCATHVAFCQIPVCKTGSPYAIGPLSVYLSLCLSVTLVYCGQTVGWIRIPLGMEVSLGPGHIVLDGDQAPHPERVTASPHFSAHVYCGQTAEWIKMLLGMEVGLGQGHIVIAQYSSTSTFSTNTYAATAADNPTAHCNTPRKPVELLEKQHLRRKLRQGVTATATSKLIV